VFTAREITITSGTEGVAGHHREVEIIQTPRQPTSIRTHRLARKNDLAEMLRLMQMPHLARIIDEPVQEEKNQVEGAIKPKSDHKQIEGAELEGVDPSRDRHWSGDGRAIGCAAD
jgi:hypothetical protein